MLKDVKNGSFALAKVGKRDAVASGGFLGPGDSNGFLDFTQGDWGKGLCLNPHKQ